MDYLRKILKAAWIMVFKPIVMAPVNLCTGKISGDSAMADFNRAGVVDLISIILLVLAGGYWLGPSSVAFKWMCIVFGVYMSDRIHRVKAVVDMLEEKNEFDHGMNSLESTFA